MRRTRTPTCQGLPGWAYGVGLVGAICFGQTCPGDDVWVGQPGRVALRYSDVTIQGDEGGKLVFRTRAGTTVSKPIEQIARIRIEDVVQIDQAEQALDRRDHAAAIAPFEQALRRAGSDWLKTYLHAKLVVCYDAEGRLPEATTSWIEVLRRWPTYAETLQPKRLHAKGSPLHRQTLNLIESALTKPDLSAEVGKSLRKLRSAIWRIEGDPRADAAGEPDRAEANRPVESAERSREQSTSETKVPTEGVDVVGGLGRATRLAESGRHDEALEEIHRALVGIPEYHRKAYLPRLLVAKANSLLARAEALAKEGKTEAARREFIHGGLAAMQVVTFFPESPSFIEALYLVGRCHEKIGRTKQAIELYRECRAYAVGRGQADWKRRATQALERLDAKP